MTIQFRDIESGITYDLHGIGLIKSERPLNDGDCIVVYRSELGGSFWARPIAEFGERRFVTIRTLEWRNRVESAWRLLEKSDRTSPADMALITFEEFSAALDAGSGPALKVANERIAELETALAAGVGLLAPDGRFAK